MLNPITDFYKKLALDCSGQHIAVDLFILNSQFVDLATLCKYCKLELHNYLIFILNDCYKQTESF